MLPISSPVLLAVAVLSACSLLADVSRSETILTSNKSFFKLGRRAQAGPSADGGADPAAAGRRRRAKRQAAGSADLSADEVAAYLDRHNELRGQTAPQAANMQYMVWDDSLATMAQQWSDMCIWGHGQPDNVSPFDSLGQNLYLTSGGTPTRRINGTGPVQSWYDEDRYYMYASDSCQTNQVCGHYTQVVWATSYAVGCAQAYCATITGSDFTDAIVVTCNYGPAGNHPRQPFTAGTPCTQCDSGIGQCYENQCRLCSTHSDPCVCAQVCDNCGTLDSNACTCACPNGFYGADCSVVCEDTHENCGANPGWPTSWCDENHSYVLTNCPVLCSICVAIRDPDYTCGPSTRAPATDAATATAPSTAKPADPSTRAPATDAATAPSTAKPADPSTRAPATDAATATAPSTAKPAATTPCQVPCDNGGTLDAACECTCTAEYQGDTCQHERQQARFGVIVILLADIAYWDYIKPYLVDLVAYILTSFCNDRFQLCCPDSGAKTTTARLDYVNESHILTASGYPEPYPDIDGAFVVMFLVVPPATAELCQRGGGAVPSSRRRRAAPRSAARQDPALPLRIHKRAVGDGPYLDQDVLLEALAENTENLTMALSGLNVSVSVRGVVAGREEPVVTRAPPTPTSPGGPTGLPVAVVVAIVAVVVLVLVIVVVAIVLCAKVSKPSKVDAMNNEIPDIPRDRENYGMTEHDPTF